MTIETWLLTRLGVDEALIGDLIEAQEAGRSRRWLWCQVAGAIASAIVKEVRTYPLQTTIAVLLGFALRHLTIRVWSAYEPSVAMDLGLALRDVLALGRPASLIAVASANALMLAPAWCGICFVVARFSRAAAPLFLAATLGLMFTGEARQLEHASAIGVVPPWVLPVQLTIFCVSIGTFAVAAFLGAALGLGKGQRS